MLNIYRTNFVYLNIINIRSSLGQFTKVTQDANSFSTVFGVESIKTQENSKNISQHFHFNFAHVYFEKKKKHVISIQSINYGRRVVNVVPLHVIGRT